MKKRWIAVIVLLTAWSSADCSQVDFDELNRCLGLTPYMAVLTDVPANASYSAFVSDPDRFAVVDENARQGDRVYLLNLGLDQWFLETETYQARIQVSRPKFPFQECVRIKKIYPYGVARSSGRQTTLPATDAVKSGAASKEAGDVQFAFDSFTIPSRYFATIEAVAVKMKRKPSLRLEIHGHACEIGTKEYNRILSRKRAVAVNNFLAKKGIPANRLAIKAFGDTQPVASNRTESGRARNRRVAFIFRNSL